MVIQSCPEAMVVVVEGGGAEETVTVTQLYLVAMAVVEEA